LPNFSAQGAFVEMSDVRETGKLDQDGYLPDFSEIKDALPALSDQSGQVTLPVGFVRFLLSQLASMQPFDRDYYANANPDVVKAVAQGTCASLHEHFWRTGYFEGRRPGERYVDRSWYLASNPDVARAYTRGDLNDLRGHFNKTGRHEGRSGSALQSSLAAQWRSELGKLNKETA